jgi:hypothetical protein
MTKIINKVICHTLNVVGIVCAYESFAHADAGELLVAMGTLVVLLALVVGFILFLLEWKSSKENKVKLSSGFFGSIVIYFIAISKLAPLFPSSYGRPGFKYIDWAIYALLFLVPISVWIFGSIYLVQKEKRAQALSPKCPYCSQPIRTLSSKQCRSCGKDWHDLESL